MIMHDDRQNEDRHKLWNAEYPVMIAQLTDLVRELSTNPDDYKKYLNVYIEDMNDKGSSREVDIMAKVGLLGLQIGYYLSKQTG